MKTMKYLTGCVIAAALWGTSAAPAADLINTAGAISGSYDNAQIGYNATIANTVNSGDSLSIGSGSSNYLLIGVTFNTTTSRTGSLDASAAASFTANVGRLFVGSSAPINPVTGSGTTGNGGAATGTLNLGTNNTITATYFLIGGPQTDVNSGVNVGTGTLTTFDNGTTTINTPLMVLGAGKGNSGTFTLGSAATLNLGTTSARTDLILGRRNATETTVINNRTVAGTMNLSGGTANDGIANLALSGLRISWNNLGLTGSGYLDGTMTLSASASNHLDIQGAGSVVQIGVGTGSAGSYTAPMTGLLTIGNLDTNSVIESTTADASAILIGAKPAGATSNVSGTLDIKQGSLTIVTAGTAGAAIAGGGNANNRRLYLGETGMVTLKAGASSTDWIKNLTTAEIKSGGLTIDTDDKTIGISQGFSGAGGLTKTGSGTLAPAGSHSFAGPLSIQAGTLSPGGTNTAALTLAGNVELASGTTLRMDVSGATHDAVSAGGTVTLGGTLTLVEGEELLLTSYPLITGTSRTGTFSATNGLPVGASIQYTTTGVVMNYSPSNPPVTPTGLTATAGDKQVALSWNASQYAAGYNLWRATAEGGPYTAAVLNHAGTNYTDTGRVNLTTYYYKVSATNGVGESARSEPAVSATPTSLKNMLTFVFPDMPATVIGSNTVTLTLATWTDVTALAPTYTVSPGASGSPVSGTTRNFTSPQTYTVTGEDTSTKNYTVTVNMPAPSTAKDILTFVVSGATTVIGATNITVTAPFWMDVTALSPTYTLSPYATCVPASGTTRNFTTPQTYTVTAQDSSTKVYTVTVNKEASPGPIAPVYTKLGDDTIRAAFTNGSGMWTVPGHVTNVRVLVVGGGGSGQGGSNNDTDGGGAGGLTYFTNYAVTAGSSVPIVVGAGGETNQDGGISVFSGLNAAGGQRGGIDGFGGNSGGLNLNGTITAGGLGGRYLYNDLPSRNGGGGAVQDGGGGYSSSPGGDGYEVDITITGPMTNTYYAGGGGGGYNGPGGRGGGGAGVVGGPGVDGLGGGGGAKAHGTPGGKGGDGVVILVYDAPPAGTVILLK